MPHRTGGYALGWDASADPRGQNPKYQTPCSSQPSSPSSPLQTPTPQAEFFEAKHRQYVFSCFGIERVEIEERFRRSHVQVTQMLTFRARALMLVPSMEFIRRQRLLSRSLCDVEQARRVLLQGTYWSMRESLCVFALQNREMLSRQHLLDVSKLTKNVLFVCCEEAQRRLEARATLQHRLALEQRLDDLPPVSPDAAALMQKHVGALDLKVVDMLHRLSIDFHGITWQVMEGLVVKGLRELAMWHHAAASQLCLPTLCRELRVLEARERLLLCEHEALVHALWFWRWRLNLCEFAEQDARRIALQAEAEWRVQSCGAFVTVLEPLARGQCVHMEAAGRVLCGSGLLLAKAQEDEHRGFSPSPALSLGLTPTLPDPQASPPYSYPIPSAHSNPCRTPSPMLSRYVVPWGVRLHYTTPVAEAVAHTTVASLGGGR